MEIISIFSLLHILWHRKIRGSKLPTFLTEKLDGIHISGVPMVFIRFVAAKSKISTNNSKAGDLTGDMV